MDKDKDREDIMVLSYEQRSLDTDRLEAPPGHIVTGVKLRNLGGHVNLELQARGTVGREEGKKKEIKDQLCLTPSSR